MTLYVENPLLFVRRCLVGRHPLGWVRDGRAAAHGRADEATVGPVLPAELAALDRGGAEDPRPGGARELPRDLWPDLGHAPPDPLGRPGGHRLRADLLRPGLAVPGGGRPGELRHAPLSEWVHVLDARAR